MLLILGRFLDEEPNKQKHLWTCRLPLLGARAALPRLVVADQSTRVQAKRDQAALVPWRRLCLAHTHHQHNRLLRAAMESPCRALLEKETWWQLRARALGAMDDGSWTLLLVVRANNVLVVATPPSMSAT